MRFTDKIILITGAGGEIGAATARRFAREGGCVIAADLNAEAVAQVAADIIASGGQAQAHPLDVANRQQVEALVAAILEQHGRIDVLANIAGIAPYEPLLEATDANWQRTLDINLTGVFLCSQVVARAMVQQGKGQRSGAIVNMASTNGLVGEFGMAGYNASKFGVVGLTMTMAIELAPYGIRVNAAAPGMIDTRLSRAVLEADPALAQSYLKDKIPLGRFGSVDEVAAVAAFLASEDASYVTGHALVVDGGQLTF